ncbi:unnamed protein product, partial [Brenthis ino]
MAMRLSTNIVLCVLLLTMIQNYVMMKIDMFNTSTSMYLQEITDYPILFKVMGVEKFNFNIPGECEERNICEHLPDYLQKYVSEIITMLSNKNIKLQGSEDVDDTAQYHTKDTNKNIDTQYEDLCSTKQVLYIPKAASDVNNTWHIILNDKQHPQYKFRVEICKINNLPCSYAYFPLDISKCIQKYTLRTMMAINEQNEVVERPFKVPSCCSCGTKNV